MNKKFLTSSFIVIALFVGALNYSKEFQSPFISALNGIKNTYHSSVEYIQNSIGQHFFQAHQISKLKKQIKNCEKNHLLMQQLASELNDLYKANDVNFTNNPEVELVRTIAYEKFGNKNRLWITMDDFNSSKIYGLVYKELVAGIVIAKNNKPLALLNNSIQSTYAVYIGDKKAPGIAHGNNGEDIIINFIPAWFKIKEGDEVVTSGLDNIFFKGLKVGKVVTTTSSQGYQSAVVKPYYQANEPDYFYIIRETK